MNYPKQLMKLSELVKVGFPEDYLLRLYRLPNQSFAMKMSDAKNSPIIFDTDRLQTYLDKERKLQQKAMIRGY